MWSIFFRLWLVEMFVCVRVRACVRADASKCDRVCVFQVWWSIDYEKYSIDLILVRSGFICSIASSENRISIKIVA
uniref:Putative secreted protein n=1 Tax=Anopheles darlingi TaxID=43151 RepID=A0A2M4DR17_ANODA